MAKSYLVGSGKVDKKIDGKTPAQRSAAAKKAAITRKSRKGDKKKISLDIPQKWLDGLKKIVDAGGDSSINEAILTAIRIHLFQQNLLKS